MNGRYTSKDRNELKLKIANVLDENLRMYSSDLREMLLDDLVTALENRLKILNKVQSDVQIEVAGSVDYETVKT